MVKTFAKKDDILYGKSASERRVRECEDEQSEQASRSSMPSARCFIGLEWLLGLAVIRNFEKAGKLVKLKLYQPFSRVVLLGCR